MHASRGIGVSLVFGLAFEFIFQLLLLDSLVKPSMDHVWIYVQIFHQLKATLKLISLF